MGLPVALLLVDLQPSLFLLVLGGWVFIGGAELGPAEEETLVVGTFLLYDTIFVPEKKAVYPSSLFLFNSLILL